MTDTFHANDWCEATWTDGVMYPALLLEVKENPETGAKSYVVQFHGYEDHPLEVGPDNIRPYSGDDQQQHQEAADAVAAHSHYDEHQQQQHEQLDLPGRLEREESAPEWSYADPEPSIIDDGEHPFYQDQLDQIEVEPPPKAKTISKRSRIAHEIVDTEARYVSALQTLHFSAVMPLKDDAKQHGDDAILDQRSQDVLFSYIQTIVNMNSQFLDKLQEVFADWDDETSCIGNLFVDFAPYFKIYTEYVNGHEHATQLLTELMAKKSSKFKDFAAKFASAGLDLSSYLIMPIQRIPRYKLLLIELIKNTPEEHPDYAKLTEALALVDKVAHHINDAVRQQQNRERIATIQNQFSGKVNFIAVGRRFVRQGDLQKKNHTGKGTQLYTFFLFNDLLVSATEASSLTLSRAFGRAMRSGTLKGGFGDGKMYKLHKEFPIDKAFEVFNLDDDEQEGNRILVVNSVKPFVIVCDTPADKVSWLKDLRRQIEHQRNTIQASSLLDSEEGDTVDLPDEAVERVSCSSCKKVFKRGLYTYRCFFCKQLACGQCTQSRLTYSAESKSSAFSTGTVKGPMDRESSGFLPDSDEKSTDEVSKPRRVCEVCVQRIEEGKTQGKYRRITLNNGGRTKRANTLTRGDVAAAGAHAHLYQDQFATLGKGHGGTARAPVVYNRKLKGGGASAAALAKNKNLQMMTFGKRGSGKSLAAALAAGPDAAPGGPADAAADGGGGGGLRNALQAAIANRQRAAPSGISRSGPTASHHQHQDSTSSQSSQSSQAPVGLPGMGGNLHSIIVDRKATLRKTGIDLSRIAKSDSGNSNADANDSDLPTMALSKTDTIKKTGPDPATAKTPPRGPPRGPPPQRSAAASPSPVGSESGGHSRRPSLSDKLKKKLSQNMTPDLLPFLRPLISWETALNGSDGNVEFSGVTLVADMGAHAAGSRFDELHVNPSSGAFEFLRRDGSDPDAMLVQVATGTMGLQISHLQ